MSAVAAIITGIVSLASAGIKAGVGAKKQKEAQSEARGLANRQYQNDLNVLKENERLANLNLKLGQKKLNFGNSQLRDLKEDFNLEKKETQQNVNQQILQQAGSQFSSSKKPESFLFRPSSMGRLR